MPKQLGKTNAGLAQGKRNGNESWENGDGGKCLGQSFSV